MDSLHLLERVSLDLQVQNSIVPTAFNLARFKVSGHLPSLQVNLSDTKYKALMRLIDVCIPKFGENTGQQATPPPLVKTTSSAFQLPSRLFSQSETEYNVDEEEEEDDDDADAGEENFFEANDGSVPVSDPLT